MKNSLKFCVAFLIMVLLFDPSHELPPFWPRTVLTMTNNLGGPLLTVHCKSKDNDLGVQKLAANTDYHFSFQPNIWKSTLFFCSFQWNNQVKHFDIFDAQRDQDDGYKFTWTIKPDGPCKLGKKVKCFPWK
ncbi:S-protein homolog 5 [Raphanus sativus]|uniref:S-protein homolog n=1 Tax=Raphanus sativus TaxID=3726 RepID=A0A6J0LXI6_RAPSA|nr:S-protein homolog 5 [Raphanus sativus]